MRHFAFLLAVIALVSLNTSVQAAIVTIDFDSLENPNNEINNVASPYVEDGFQITGTPFNSFGQANYRYAGSAGLLVAASNGQAVLMQVDGGGIFDLLSIELSIVEPSGTPTEVTFVGNLAGGGTTMQSFTPLGFGFTQFDFDGAFANLVTVSWLQGPGNSSLGHQFDNIVVNGGDIPEPATVVIWATLAGLGLIAARRPKRTET
ncbi:MAG: hypothetical protein JW888_01920 [Pirellulales bacterium]|nr:hypothetical protein [Pirellulales bacterium]